MRAALCEVGRALLHGCPVVCNRVLLLAEGAQEPMEAFGPHDSVKVGAAYVARAVDVAAHGAGDRKADAVTSLTSRWHCRCPVRRCSQVQRTLLYLTWSCRDRPGRSPPLAWMREHRVATKNWYAFTRQAPLQRGAKAVATVRSRATSPYSFWPISASHLSTPLSQSCVH